MKLQSTLVLAQSSSLVSILKQDCKVSVNQFGLCSETAHAMASAVAVIIESSTCSMGSHIADLSMASSYYSCSNSSRTDRVKDLC